RIARGQAVAGADRRRAGLADRDLDDPVAEQALGLDTRNRVLADAIRELPTDREIDPNLAARMRRQVHGAHAADLHAGEADRRALDGAADLGEVRADRVARLEQPRPGPGRAE